MSSLAPTLLCGGAQKRDAMYEAGVMTVQVYGWVRMNR